MADHSFVETAGGIRLPLLGVGTYKVPGPEAAALVSSALDAGYRLVDTAEFYGNERAVGEAVRAAVDGGLGREDVFVTSKVWNDHQGHDAALRAFDASMERLGLEYLDLYLIHWPCPRRDLYVQTWKALERLRREGRVRAIGVSNFMVPHLERVLAEAEIPPAVNQVELHPALPQRELVDFHQRHGIITQAHSPLGRGPLLGHPMLAELAAETGHTPAQLVLAWHRHRGVATIPKSSSPARQRENLASLDLRLEETVLAGFDAFDTGARVGSHPEKVN